MRMDKVVCIQEEGQLVWAHKSFCFGRLLTPSEVEEFDYLASPEEPMEAEALPWVPMEMNEETERE